MRFKLDQNLGVRGKALLATQGHDVETAQDENLSTAPDAVLAAECKQERRALITLDLDFADPFVYPPSEYAGIVVVRIPNTGTVADIETALRALLAYAGRESIAGRLLIADHRGRVRVYRATPPT